MPDFQGIALIISSTTALLAVGSPFGLRWWEERDRRKREKRDQIEERLFFALENYQDQAAGVTAFFNEYRDQLQSPQGNLPRDWYKRADAAPGFRSSLLRLRALRDLYGIDDHGFCNAVQAYVLDYVPPATGDLNRYADALAERAQELQKNSAEVEEKAVAFLRNIEQHFV